MDERDLHAEEAGAGRAVDQLDPLALEPLELAGQVVDLVGDVVHPGAAAVEERTVWERTFGRVPVGASLVMADSEGHLTLADNQGDAAKRLGLQLDRPVRIRPA